jgi:hypothetical protein
MGLAGLAARPLFATSDGSSNAAKSVTQLRGCVATEDIPRDVVEFLADHIDSVVQLEVLLLLHSRRDAAWQAGDVARELRIDSGWTEAALAKLAAAGILDQPAPAAWRYAPRAPQVDLTVSRLADEYSQRRVSIISLIFSKPADPIRQFTDAFRFRPEKDQNPQQER